MTKNRLHLDLITDSWQAGAERLAALGAQRLRYIQGKNAHWTTFAGIKGNDLDLISR